MGPTKGPNGFSTFFKLDSWDLNLAGKWGQQFNDWIVYCESTVDIVIPSYKIIESKLFRRIQ